MFRVIKGELEIGARWRLRMTSLENQNNAIFPFPRYYRTGVFINHTSGLVLPLKQTLNRPLIPDNCPFLLPTSILCTKISLHKWNFCFVLIVV